MQSADPEAQERFWIGWNEQSLEHRLPDRVSRLRAEFVLRSLHQLGVRDADILEVGCGTGWFSEQLVQLGRVTAIDLASDIIVRAQRRLPQISFLAGDVLSLDIPSQAFDAIVTMETIAHVAEQKRFVERLAGLLRTDGYLLLTTQNRFVFERREDVAPLGDGQIRRWLSRRELRTLLKRHFRILKLTTLVPTGHRGVLRLINSTRLNRAASKILTVQRVRDIKERCGLGQTIVAVAQLSKR